MFGLRRHLADTVAVVVLVPLDMQVHGEGSAAKAAQLSTLRLSGSIRRLGWFPGISRHSIRHRKGTPCGLLQRAVDCPALARVDEKTKFGAKTRTPPAATKKSLGHRDWAEHLN